MLFKLCIFYNLLTFSKMDIAYYLSELLGQLGEVNVPGLGYFVLLRLDGYYNAEEGVFYPPGHKIQFDPQFIEDDTVLAQYIADKKHISLASSKYFTKKYIDNLVQEITTKEVALADMGTLYFDHSHIKFKATDVYVNDPANFGYPQIKIKKLEGASILELLRDSSPYDHAYPAVAPQPEPFTNKPPEPEQPYSAPAEQVTERQLVTHKENIIPPPVFTPAAQADEEDFVFKGKTYVDENNSRWRIWLLVIVILLALAGLGVYGLYKYKPVAFHRLMGAVPTPIVLKKEDTAKKVTTPDTAKRLTDSKGSTVITDTTLHAKTTASALNDQPAIDSMQARYEIICVKWKSMAQANKTIANYKTLGIAAHVVTDAPGPLIKISLGTYSTDADAEKARAALIASGKVKKDIYISKINPKQ